MAILRQRTGAARASAEDLTPVVNDETGLIEFAPSTFTVKELLGAIPKRCFERSALRSSVYLVQDIAFIVTFVYLATLIDPAFGIDGAVLRGWAGVSVKWAAWSFYWIFNGMACTGVWVVGGHQAFSTSKQLNNGLGLILHSLLFVPYHAWRISHARHHAATGHLTREEVHVPRTRSQRVTGPPRKVLRNGMEMEQLLDDAPLYRLWHLIAQQLFGWPAYLLFNASSHINPVTRPGWVNHFLPSSALFDKRHKPLIVLSDVSLFVAFALLYVLASYIGWADVAKYYGVPYLMVNHWLVMITYLQHTDPTLPYYRAPEWTFTRGALCTMDRTLMGPCGAIFFHGITETHVAHHLASKIPHYHAWKASEALQSVLGNHYFSTDENMFVSLWKTAQSCRFVEDEGDVVFFKNAYGEAVRRVAADAVDSGVDVDEVVEADC